MFELRATHVDWECIPGDLSYAAFWDDSKSYGVSFSCYVERPDEAMEIMVSDQSPYHPSIFDVELSHGILRLSLPPGTIDPKEGEDEYLVHFKVDAAQYVALVKTMTYLVSGRGHLRCTT